MCICIYANGQGANGRVMVAVGRLGVECDALCVLCAEAERMRKEEGQRNGDSFCLENMSAI